MVKIQVGEIILQLVLDHNAIDVEHELLANARYENIMPQVVIEQATGRDGLHLVATKIKSQEQFVVDQLQRQQIALNALSIKNVTIGLVGSKTETKVILERSLDRQDVQVHRHKGVAIEVERNRIWEKEKLIANHCLKMLAKLTILATIELDTHRDTIAPSRWIDANELSNDGWVETVDHHRVAISVALKQLLKGL